MKKYVFLLALFLVIVYLCLSCNSKKGASDNSSESNDTISYINSNFEELLKKAESGDTNLKYELGFDYIALKSELNDTSALVKWITNAAANWITKVAEQEDADAQYYLGKAFDEGAGVSEDFSEALKWYTKAAEQFNTKALSYLGRRLLLESSDKRNVPLAYMCSLKAVALGDGEGAWNLAQLYTIGFGIVPKNDRLALKWNMRGAHLNQPSCQVEIGHYYYNQEEYSTAAYWYRRAAEQNNPDGQTALGECYYNGDGVNQSYTAAIKWFKKAAEQEGYLISFLAQYYLGLCYENGYGVSQNREEAIKWYKKSCEMISNSPAKERLDMLGEDY